MYVKCLGSGDAFSSGGRLNAGFYVRSRSMGILIDCGASTLPALKKENLSAEDVDVILITHLHGDHFGGLPFMLCEIIALKNRAKPLTIIGPENIRQKTEQSLECFYSEMKITKEVPIHFITYVAGETLAFETLRVTPYKAVHSVETHPHSLRVEIDNKVISYSGDSEWTDDLIRASEGADLFICEASSYLKPVKNHLSVKQLVEQLDRIHAKKIVLTHLGDEALKHLRDIPLAVAKDGAILLHDLT